VTRATCNGVQQAVARFADVPDHAARSLSTRDTRCFGALPPDVYGELLSDLIRGIDRTACSRRRHLSCSHADAAQARAGMNTPRGRNARSRAARAFVASAQRRR